MVIVNATRQKGAMMDGIGKPAERASADRSIGEEVGLVVSFISLVSKFWPIITFVAVVGCVISYLVEFSIFNIDAFYVMNMNDLVFKSSQNVIWFFSITLYVIAVSYVVGVFSKLPIALRLFATVLVIVIALSIFILGANTTLTWDRYVHYKLEGITRDAGLNIVHLAPGAQATAEAEIAWSRTHFVAGIRADAFAWMSLASIGYLAIAVVGLAARRPAFSTLPMILPAIVAPVLSLNASLGIDRAMLLDPKISRLEEDRGYTFLHLPPELQSRCPETGVVIWQGEKSLVQYCARTRTNFIYLKDYGSVVSRSIR